MRRSSRHSVTACVLAGFSVLLFVSATRGMLTGEEPFFSWYYCFAWWSYILFMESLLHLRGGFSSLLEDTRAFLKQLPLSVTIWLVFEAFNFRLSNWYYIEIVKEIEWRWVGYALSFATVLPGIFVSRRFLEHLGVARDVHCPPLENPRRLCGPFVVAGVLLLLAPLLWPRFFFRVCGWGSFSSSSLSITGGVGCLC